MDSTRACGSATRPVLLAPSRLSRQSHQVVGTLLIVSTEIVTFGKLQLLDTACGLRVLGWKFGQVQGRVTVRSQGETIERVTLSEPELVTQLLSAEFYPSIELISAELEPYQGQPLPDDDPYWP